MLGVEISLYPSTHSPRFTVQVHPDLTDNTGDRQLALVKVEQGQ
jgi:hypothetical protein